MLVMDVIVFPERKVSKAVQLLFAQSNVDGMLGGGCGKGAGSHSKLALLAKSTARAWPDLRAYPTAGQGPT